MSDYEDALFYDKQYDFKLASVIHEQRKQEDSVTNWIYIGVDTRHKYEAKIGLTTGKLGTRSYSSHNPSYTLLCAFKIKEGVCNATVKHIEEHIKEILSERYKNIRHVGSNERSEWFRVSPYDLRQEVHDLLYEHHQRHMYCYYCGEREVGVIYSWENRALLNGESRNPYKADDCSNPPVHFSCFMPGGCGHEDCNCFD